jgi:hypothetical protein
MKPRRKAKEGRQRPELALISCCKAEFPNTKRAREASPFAAHEKSRHIALTAPEKSSRQCIALSRNGMNRPFTIPRKRLFMRRIAVRS